MRFGCSNWKGNSMHASLCRLVLSSSIYNIWSFRNEINHNGHPKIEEQLLKVIFWEVRSIILRRGKFQKSQSQCCPQLGLEH
jgi:hypothetical protein